MDRGSSPRLGHTVRFGTSQWTVVGVFEDEGNGFESEAWADLSVVQSFFKPDNVFETVRARARSPAALKRLQQHMDTDPRLKLEAKPEAATFQRRPSAYRT
jgi:putative ABC transport system permease protein